MENSSESDFHKVLGRALVDIQFRNDLTSGDKDRQTAALESLGIRATPDTIEALNASVDALQRLSGAFGDAVAAT
jgi:hypothetical protein